MSQNQNSDQNRNQNENQPSSEQLLDVRTIDGPPFGDIMSALGSLDDDGQLRLVAGFEPKPLYEVLEARGFTYETECRERTDEDNDDDDEEWHVLIETA
ncbi:DUF2249 domain-containing protein [Natronoglomus mannanivorans]|uniref:DUF2249 domain-containing protein n=1 Tax=Natronoglomus mannanivorans TaxID=2979990 RepID=A0AAP2Z0Y3_9EURY|nr:DUF2249 domain-containing protein [Halobacteria archaeon AArc-xg1-1]